MHPIKTPREIRNNTRELLNVTSRMANVLDQIVEQSNSDRAGIPGSNYGLYSRGGLELLLDRTSVVDQSLIEIGTWEPDQLELMRGLVTKFRDNPSFYFLDIGSYWGLYSLIAAQAGAPNIVAYEADRFNYRQLLAQQFLNGMQDKVLVHNLAVSDTNGTAQFHDSRNHPDGNRGGVGLVSGGSSPQTYEVQTVSIDDHLGLTDKIIIGKLDVEGHEARVLQGMRETIRNCKVFLQVECFDEHKVAIKEMADLLGLRKAHEISVDQYLTNMDPGEIGF